MHPTEKPKLYTVVGLENENMAHFMRFCVHFIPVHCVLELIDELELIDQLTDDARAMLAVLVSCTIHTVYAFVCMHTFF